jgi:hypothetical protein
MIFAGAAVAEVPRYRPTYEELADPRVVQRYKASEFDLISSREGSEFLRRKFARNEAHLKLSALSALPANWDSYGAEAPNATSILAARYVVDLLMDNSVVPDAVLSSAEGGVAICFVRDGKYADVECLNTGEVLAVKYSRDENPRAWSVENTRNGVLQLAHSITAYLAD